MSKESDLKINTFSKDVPKLVNWVNQPILTSLNSGWEGISLFFHKQPPMETSEHRLMQHCITIPTRSTQNIEEKLDGQLTISTFQPQQISITPADHFSQYRWTHPVEIVQIALNPEVFSRIAYETVDPDKVELIPNFVTVDPLIYQIGIALKSELRKQTSCKLYAESACIFLGSHLLRNYAHITPILNEYGDGLSTKKLHVVIDYIQAHLTEDLSIELIANQVQMSQYYFCRLFKNSMGSSPHQYIIQKRVQLAKKLLQDNSLLISDIALSCGFSNQSHLTKYFKKITGVTPRKFRKFHVA